MCLPWTLQLAVKGVGPVTRVSGTVVTGVIAADILLAVPSSVTSPAPSSTISINRNKSLICDIKTSKYVSTLTDLFLTNVELLLDLSDF